LALLRRRLVWVVLAVAALACIPLVLGIGGSRRAVESGPLSDAHAIFEKRCEVCHSQSFHGVPDQACSQCHDGGPHPAKMVDSGHPKTEIRCAQCPREHRREAGRARWRAGTARRATAISQLIPLAPG
jgi:hypothetical protein